MRQIILQDGGLTWNDRDGTPMTSLPVKFCMPYIECYSGIGCPKIYLRLYIELSRLCTWEDVAHEFLTQFAFSVDIDVSRQELEATRQRPDESISSFVNLKSLVQAAFTVDEAIARRLWTNTGPSPDSKGKKPVRSSSRF
ncbi:hypothetical protein CK203_039118 [Vitis vinifera]|uniref:Retrotransposon gag domain-containing protein n=1 Tax=Vitis vinifera TaxID=29760 RepID=A0A438IFS3_VITVI|nr:hypothetical protein CK203_039118 [Vitis vinifera]